MPAWTVLRLPEFDEWFESLDDRGRKAMDAPIQALAEIGPTLGRPYVDTVYDSEHSNMKELRETNGTLRAFFAFDPKRRAILLIGGDKSGNKKFYTQMIRKADKLFSDHLTECEAEEKGSKKS